LFCRSRHGGRHAGLSLLRFDFWTNGCPLASLTSTNGWPPSTQIRATGSVTCGLACRNACEAASHARRLKDTDITLDRGHQNTFAKTYNPGTANSVLFRSGVGACSPNAVDVITAAVHAKEYPVDGLNLQRNGPTVLRVCAKSTRIGGPDRFERIFSRVS